MTDPTLRPSPTGYAQPRQSVRAYEQPLAQTARPGRAGPREVPRAREAAADTQASRPADGYWFRHWIEGAGDKGSGNPGDAQAFAGLAGKEDGMAEHCAQAFAEQLSPRLSVTSAQALQMLLHLPYLGRIRVAAQRLDAHAGWLVELDSDSDEARGHLARAAERCGEALARGLGVPVQIRLGAGAVER